MRDPPLAWYGPPKESRWLGAAACVLFTIGSTLAALTVLDVGRYAAFVCTAARFASGPHFSAPSPELLAPVVALPVLVLLGSSWLASPKRQAGGWLAMSLVTVSMLFAIAWCITTFRAIHPPPLVSDFVPLPITCDDALWPVASAFTFAAATLAIVLVRHTPRTRDRLACVAVVLPLAIAGLSLTDALSRAPELDPARLSRMQLDALVHLLERTRPFVLAAIAPGVIAACMVRARPSFTAGAVLWLGLGAGLFAATRPYAADASDVSHARYLSGDAQLAWPDFDGPIVDVSWTADPASEIRSALRSWALDFPRRKEPVACALRTRSSDLPVATWIRAAEDAGVSELWLVESRVDVWSTQTRRTLVRTNESAVRVER